MSAGAWLFMSLSFLLIIALNLFCLGRLIQNNKNDKR